MLALVIIETIILIAAVTVIFMFIRSYKKHEANELTDKEQDQIRQVLEVLFYKGDSNENKN